MSRDPAQSVELAALAANAAELEAEFDLGDLKRIAPLLRRTTGVARGRFRFYRLAGEPSFAAAEGRVSATLALTCQRCLEEVSVAIQARCQLAFVPDESAALQLPESHEPVIAGDGHVALAELVEDELLLARPLVPLHADAAACAAEVKPAEPAARQQTQLPFAGLRELLKD